MAEKLSQKDVFREAVNPAKADLSQINHDPGSTASADAANISENLHAPMSAEAKPHFNARFFMNKQTESDIERENHSFQIESETQLMNAFSEKDQKRVLLPHGVSYPIQVPHYYSWKEPSGVYVYMIIKKPEWKSPVGLVFKRAYSGSTLTNSRLCDWCLSYGSSDQVGMLSLSLNPRESIGMMLCLDLGCAHRLEEVAELSGKNFEKLVGQLYERVSRFFDSVLREKRDVNIEQDGSESLH